MNTHPADRGATPPDPIHSSAHSRLKHIPPIFRLPQYRVVLFNNAERDMMFVVRTIMELTRLCRTESLHKMWQAHYNGKSNILVTHRERAELFVELFGQRGVQVGIEPV